ncbi:MAG: hypothetical protein IJT50_02625 [Lentisphaeria bacterium]|nr:hypothetical protein [Lentisphaeria bacterium]
MKHKLLSGVIYSLPRDIASALCPQARGISLFPLKYNGISDPHRGTVEGQEGRSSAGAVSEVTSKLLCKKRRFLEFRIKRSSCSRVKIQFFFQVAVSRAPHIPILFRYDNIKVIEQFFLLR